MKKWFSVSLDLLLPPRCAGCNALVDPGAIFCPVCAPSLLDADQDTRIEGCATTHSMFLYGGQLGVALRRLKYGDAPELARPLGRLLSPALEELAPRIQRIIPVPLHRRRLRQRGFNQAQLLALSAARSARIRIPVDPTLLVRQRDTLSQSKLSWVERRRNVQGAFAVRRPQRCRGQRVLLVDDVLTTGATASAAAAALGGAGAVEIHVLTVARTMP